MKKEKALLPQALTPEEMSLRQLLAQFSENPDDFDPEKVIGSLEGKVDAINWRVDTFLAESEVHKAWAMEYSKRATALANAAQRLKEYVQRQLVLNGLEGLQGRTKRIALQNNSQPTLEIPHAPGPQDYLQYPKYVRQDVQYAWNKETIVDDVDAGTCPIPNVSVKRGKHIRFYAAKEVLS